MCGSLSYDAAGDLKADALNNTYTYNAEGMLSSMTSPANTAQYTYDALDQRVEKTGGSYPTETIYFQGKPIALLNATSGAWTDLIWAGGGLIAEVAGTQTATPSYRLLDHEGSLVMTTDGSGNVTGTNVLSPYGEVLSSNTSDSFSYAGLTQDTEYGGDAATFRNYTAEQLRWTRPDPYDGSYDLSNPQSMNRYMYVNGNPLGFVDPSGLTPCTGNQTIYVTPSGTYSSPPTVNCPSYLTPQQLCQYLASEGFCEGAPEYPAYIPPPVVPGKFKGTTNDPLNDTITPESRTACAASVADNEYSIAAHTSGASPNNPFVRAFLGNSISGLYNLWNSPSISAGLKSLTISGFNPGIPGGPTVGGYPVDGGVVGVATQAAVNGASAEGAQISAQAAGAILGAAKFVYDVGSFVYAYEADCN